MTHYDTLGVAKDASSDEIRAAYRRASSEAHPDREGGSTDRQAAVNKAYAVLRDPESRARYNETGDDRPAVPLAEVAEKILLSLFAQAIHEGHDWLGWCSRYLEKEHKDMNARVAEIRQRVRGLQKRRDKVHVKEGRNLVHMVIDQAIAQADATLLQAGQAIDANRLAFTTLANYESSEEPPQQLVVSGETLYSSWSR